MRRQMLTDGSGSWFDLDSAEEFEEATFFDGRNLISQPTGSQWAHQTLYRTKSKRWVICSWSQWLGSRATYEEISDSEAAAWLVAKWWTNDQEHPDAAEEIARLEI